MSDSWAEGHLYFVIRNEDAAAGRFDQTYAVHQQT